MTQKDFLLYSEFFTLSTYYPYKLVVVGIKDT